MNELDKIINEIFGDVPSPIIESSDERTSNFYRHKPGLYFGFIGKTVHKFKSASGEYVDPSTTTDAKYSHSVVQLWINKYYGSNNEQVNRVYITTDESGNFIVPDIPIRECYYPLIVKSDPDKQWINKILFKDFHINNAPQYDIITPHPNNPAKFYVQVKNLVYYAGRFVKFTLTEGKNDYIYVSELKLVGGGITLELLKTFLTLVDRRFEEEKSKLSSDNQYQRETPPPPDFGELEDFLK